MHKRNGFTIVELLIVIVIIAILAAITIVAYNGIQTRAIASSLASDLKATEKAFTLYKTSAGLDSWPADNSSVWDGTITGDPPLIKIITNNAEFRSYLQRPTTVEKLNSGTSVWTYDNDNDAYSGCAASGAGVNIKLQNANNIDVIKVVDSQIDDGDLACGKMRMSGTTLLYSLALSSAS